MRVLNGMAGAFSFVALSIWSFLRVDGDDIRDELDIDLAPPAKENYFNERRFNQVR